MTGSTRVGIIGAGSIGSELVRILAEFPTDVTITAVLRHTTHNRSDVGTVFRQISLVTSIADLMQSAPDVVVECAGHAAVATLGPGVLRSGSDLMLASVGALAQPEVEQALRESATSSGAKILIPSGAIGALDALASARISGLTRVVYRGTKPPQAWRGAIPEAVLERCSRSDSVQIFAGTAREAALRFPRNANVAAAVALAGLGFDATTVELMSQRTLTANQHEVMAEGAFGSCHLVMRARVSSANPRTSMLAAGSLAKCLLNRRALLSLG